MSVTTSTGSIAINPRIGLVPIEASSDAEAVLARAIAAEQSTTSAPPRKGDRNDL